MPDTTQQPSPARAALIDKLRKLSKFTTQNGCTEAEAQAALQKVASLMAEHNVAQDELSVREDALHCLTDEFIEMNDKVGDWSECCINISKLFGTKVWVSSREEDPLDLGFTTKVKVYKYFGFAADVAASLSMTAIIYTAIISESEHYKGRSERDFILGMTNRLKERLKEMIDRAYPPAVTGRGLIVLKDQLVTDEFAKLNLGRLRDHNFNTRVVDGKAYRAGQAAGSRVNLSANDHINSTAQQRRLS